MQILFLKKFHENIGKYKNALDPVINGMSFSFCNRIKFGFYCNESECHIVFALTINPSNILVSLRLLLINEIFLINFICGDIM